MPTQSETQVQLPKWKSHKEVWADKITNIGAGSFILECGGLIGWSNTDLGNRIEAGEKKPQVGDYYVQYEDGYQSWSPADVFEAGYTRL